MLSCYNPPGVVEVSAEVERLLREIEKLDTEEQYMLYRALLRKVAVPINKPEEIFDDWYNLEVDAAYGCGDSES
ncbi:MAG: hypothetical protein ACPLTR_12480 [Thermacetogeniaceae bacterium]